MITMDNVEWEPILEKLKIDWAHKPSVFLLREVMKRELGFTVRHSQPWDEKRYRWVHIIYLDFYDEQSETMFRLKYL